MLVRQPLDEVFANRARTKVLRVLLQNSPLELTGRELARRAGISHAQAGAALGSLELAGVVVRRLHGRAQTWLLEEGNFLASPLRDLFAAEQKTLESLTADIRSALSGISYEQVRIFGSVARGDQSPHSDLDLFVEVKTRGDASKAKERLRKESLQLRNRFGLWISPLVYTSAELKHPSNPGLVSEIHQEGLLVAGGD